MTPDNSTSPSLLQYITALTEWVSDSTLIHRHKDVIECYFLDLPVKETGEWLAQYEDIARVESESESI